MLRARNELIRRTFTGRSFLAGRCLSARIFMPFQRHVPGGFPRIQRFAASLLGCVNMAFALAVLTVSAPAVEPTSTAAETLNVMSFNIRWPMAEDTGARSWARRCPLVVRLIREHRPDVVGLQEAHPDHLRDLLNALADYAALPAADKGAANAILYRRACVRVVEAAQFKLVNPVGMPGDRHCTWARLTDSRDGASFFVYNVHFDNRTPAARTASARVLAAHIRDRSPADPVVVTGDFNADEDAAPMRYLLGRDPLQDDNGRATMTPIPLVDTFRARHDLREGIGTGHGFAGFPNGRRIDAILVSSDMQIVDAEIVRDHEDGVYASDHFPVTAKIILPAKAPAASR
jgi:endonuclease/exonuclease/phosphatase family metal-dependent hydrolase